MPSSISGVFGHGGLFTAGDKSRGLDVESTFLVYCDNDSLPSPVGSSCVAIITENHMGLYFMELRESVNVTALSM